ncbi:MAG: hypothetical protein NTX03_15460 [Bacteroidetes bacterium]|nr:hypothetical protein [Bacteroidota bacterium]
MKNAKIIYLIALSLIFSTKSYCQSDSLKKDSATNLFIGNGAGLSYLGSGIAGNLNLIFPNNWGGSLNVKKNNYTSPDFPDGYQAGTNFINDLIPPGDRMYLITVNALRRFNSKRKGVSNTFETGVSFINYGIASYEGYDRGSSWFHLLPIESSNYTVEYTASNSIGLSLRAAHQFHLSETTWGEIAAYANINKYRPVVGVEFYVNFHIN